MLLKTGMKVRVNVPTDEQGAERLLKFNGLVTEITDIKRVKVVDGLGRANRYSMYELKWCTTLEGRPYYFVKEWLEVPKGGSDGHNESV